MARPTAWALLAGCLLFLGGRRAFAPPAGRVLRRAAQGTDAVIEVPPEAVPAAGASNETNVTAEEKKARVMAKTAATKERVEEKRQRLRAEARTREIAAPSEKPLIDWKEFAAQARDMAEESRKEAVKDAGELDVFVASAKESFFQLLSVGCETAAKVPPVLQGFSVFFLVLLVSFNAKQGGSDTEIRSVQASPAPTVVVPKAEVLPPPPAPVPVAPKAIAPPPAPKPSVAGQGLASSAADVLRSIADGLPAAERSVEERLPAAQSAGQSALQWASELNSENAAERVEKDVLPSAGRLAGEAVRLGLRLGATGLQFVGENLPAAEEAIGSAVDKGLPYAQSALREVASNARRLADEGVSVDSSNPTAQSAAAAVPDILKVTAGALDSAADLAPSVKEVLGYAAGAATPLAQATLSAASSVVSDVSNVPSEAVGDSLTKVADTVKAAAPQAVDTAKQLLSKAKEVPQVPASELP